MALDFAFTFDWKWCR